PLAHAPSLRAISERSSRLINVRNEGAELTDVIELLDAVATAEPGRVAVVRGNSAVTYGGLRTLARACAAGLVELGVPRVAVCEPDAARTIALLAAASLTGVEVCLYPSDATPDDVADLAKRFDHAVVVT